MKRKSFSRYLITFSLNLVIVSAYAVNSQDSQAIKPQVVSLSEQTLRNVEFARAEIEGFTGNYSGANGYGMLKIAGNNKQLFYGSVYGNYQDSTQNNILGAGIGYRNTLKTNELLGVYVYVDRNDLRDNDFFKNTSFWVVNPGVEWMGKNWDLHVNGYLPTSNRQWTIRDGWADDFGVYQYERLKGNTMYDKRMTEYANIGKGFDVAIGYTLPDVPRAKVYVGGYYFNQNDGTKITGGFGKINFALTQHTALTITDTYDKEKHNTFTVGLRVLLGRKNNVDYTVDDISERMLEAPQRNWIAQNYGTSVPVTKSSHTYALSDSGFDKELDNIYSFIPNNNTNNVSSGSNSDPQADGTFEHPYSYSDFNQDTINKIGPNANLFFGGAGNARMGTVNILSGQNIYGRTSDFIRPASGDERATLEGSLSFGGNNILDSIRLENVDGVYQKGINFTNSDTTVYLRNVNVGDANDASKSFTVGINVSDVNLLDISNSHIYAANYYSTPFIYGLEIRNSKVNIKDSTINSENILVGSGTQVATSYGIFADNASLNISGGAINTSDVVRGINAASVTSYGIYANNYAQIEVVNTNISVSSDAKATDAFSSAIGNAYGAFADNNSAINMKGGSIAVDSKAQGVDTGQGNGYGLYALHSSTIQFANGTINVDGIGTGTTSGDGNSYGAYVDHAALLLTSAVVNGMGKGNINGMGYGIYAVNDAHVNLNSGNDISGSGILTDIAGTAGNGYGIYAENAHINIGSSTIAGSGSSNAYGIYAKAGDTINLLDRNSLFVAHNLSSLGSGDAIGIYSDTSSTPNYFTNDNYKYSGYNITGGSNTHNWYPDPLLQLATIQRNNRK